jgi:MFS family permease
MTIQIRRVYPLIRLTTALALMTLGCSAMWAGAIVLEPIANEFNTGRGNSSLIYGTFMIGFALGGVFMGRLADRMGIMLLSRCACQLNSPDLPGIQFVVRVSGIIVQHGPAYR